MLDGRRVGLNRSAIVSHIVALVDIAVAQALRAAVYRDPHRAAVHVQLLQAVDEGFREVRVAGAAGVDVLLNGAAVYIDLHEGIVTQVLIAGTRVGFSVGRSGRLRVIA